METKITINFNKQTFSVEIHDMRIRDIKNLSAIGQAVVDNLKAHLIIIGADPEMAERDAIRLSQGTHDIGDIL